MKTIADQMSKNKRNALLAILFLTIEAFCDLYLPTLLASIIDKGIKDSNLELIIYYGKLMLLVTVFGALMALLRNYLSSIVAFRISEDLRKNIFESIANMPLNSRLKYDDGSLMVRLTSDVNVIQQFSNRLMRVFLKAPLLGIGSFIMIAKLNPGFLWIYLFLIPASIVLIWVNIHIGLPLYESLQKAMDHMNGYIKDFLSGIRVVRAFNQNDFENNRYEKNNEELAESNAVAMRVMAIFPAILSLIIFFAVIAILVQSSFWVELNKVDVGQVVAFINYIMQYWFASMILTHIFSMLVRAKTSSKRIEEVLDEMKINPDKSVKQDLLPIKTIDSISLDHVDFSYLPNQKVLQNITLNLKKGEKLGVIGPTGSGKSALIKALMGFYPIASGQILVNGLELTTCSRKDYLAHIGYVPQKTTLLTGTIKNNILWGKPESEEVEVMEAAKMAVINKFIEGQKEAYETLIGRNGVNLSGGQKQRVSIARALIRKPDLLILDDSTSAVDVFTEMQLLENFKKVNANMMIIMIAQRVTSIMDADKIMVLDQGKIVGYGNHMELKASCQLYQEIYSSQVEEVDKHVG